MHILHALTHSSLGGGQAVPYLLIKNLQKYHPEISHTVLLPAEGIFAQRFRDLSVNVVEFPLNRIRPKYFLRLKSILRSINPTVIHSHGRGAGLYLRSISQTQVSARRVHTHHGFHLPDRFPAATAFIAAEGLFLKNTDRIISVSQSESDVIVRANPGSRNKIRIIENIVDKNDILAASGQASESLREITDTFNGKFVVTMVGRDDPIKNYSLAFSVARNSIKINGSLLFVFIGIEQNNAELFSLQKSYPHNIKILPPMENPVPILARSSILLLTSKREAGAPLVMMEAACMGVPVVGVRVRGLLDSIQHGVNGMCVEPTVDEVSEALLNCAGNEQYMAQLKEGARRSSDRFDVRSWCERYYAMYRELLSL